MGAIGSKTRPYQFSLQTAIIAGSAFVVLLTAAIVHTAWSYTSDQNIADLRSRLADQVTVQIADKIDGLLSKAAIARRELPISGVAGFRPSFNRLSPFLDEIKLPPGSFIILTNTASQVVAARSADQQSFKPAALGAPASLDETDTPWARAVSRVITRDSLNLQELSQPYFTKCDEESFATPHYLALAPLNQFGLIVVIVIPEGDLIVDVNENLTLLASLLTVLVLLLVIATSVVTRRYLGKPLSEVVQNLRHLQNFEHANIVTQSSPFTEIAEVSGAIKRMDNSLASFGKYIPRKLVRRLFEQGIEARLGAEQRTLTALFVDLANFTRISEILGDDVAEFLGDYLSTISEVVQGHGGTIDKYIGDCVMAFWGAPEVHAAPALSACQAALACSAKIAALREVTRSRGLPDVYARIGINTGTALVGNFGSSDRLNYTAIGDSINVAARLESLNKTYKTEILIGESTYAIVRDHVVARLIDRVSVYGRAEANNIYELIAMKTRDGERPLWIDLYERGLEAMKQSQWDAAIDLFTRTIETRGQDYPSSVQIERAKSYALAPPRPDWDGRVVMMSK